MTLHQDKNEHDFSAPIVSFSFGLPATFLFGGLTRAATVLRLPLTHGDAVVWGGPARMRYHGILPIAKGSHELTGMMRINLTVRQAA
jgi:alkylated DNA repair protein (DNA oxidative demethylase)